MRVLVVEDDADIATLISVAFRREGNEVAVDGTSVPLTRREFQILRCLVEHRNRFMSRDRLLDRVGGTESPSMRAPSTCTWAGCGPGWDRPATRSRRCSVSAIGSPRTL